MQDTDIFKILRNIQHHYVNVEMSKEESKLYHRIKSVNTQEVHLVAQHNRKQKIRCEKPENNELSNESIIRC